MNEPTIPAVKRDLELAKKVKEALLNPRNLTKKSVTTFVELCIECLERLRMGGRSTPLLALCTLLWHRSNDIQISDRDVEKLFCTGFHIAGDPSYGYPEAGVLLVGTLLAKCSNKLPINSREDIFNQARMMLEYIEQGGSYPNSVRLTASCLLEAWDMKFENGLTDAVNVLKTLWPDTSPISSIPQEIIEKEIENIELNFVRLQFSITDRQRRIYRLYLQRKGRWLLDYLDLDNSE